MLGFDNGARALPRGIPGQQDRPPRHLHAGRRLQPGRDHRRSAGCSDNQWRPVSADGAPGQNWGAVFGNRFGKLGVVASVTHSYKEQYVEEQRAFYPRRATGDELEAVSDYACRPARRRPSSASSATWRTSSRRTIASRVENFYSHSGRDEGRYFEGPQHRERSLLPELPPAVHRRGADLERPSAGEHFFRGLANSRIDWRVNFAQREPRRAGSARDAVSGAVPARHAAAEPTTFTLADESQSGFRMFNTLDDETIDVGGELERLQHDRRPSDAVQVRRQLRRAHARLPVAPVPLHPDRRSTRPTRRRCSSTRRCRPRSSTPSSNIGTAFRFNEETRPVDAYDGEQTTTAGYGMVDIALSAPHPARWPARASSASSRW